MINGFDKLAWFGVALAILAWAIVPRMAAANAVFLPPVPKITVSVLPPPLSPAPAETRDRRVPGLPGR